MAENKQFPTPEMLKAEEEWNKKTPEEKEAINNALREKLRKYYASRFPIETQMALRDKVRLEQQTADQRIAEMKQKWVQEEAEN